MTETPAAPGRILALTHDPRHPLLASWMGGLRHPVDTVNPRSVDQAIPEGTGLVVTWACYEEPHVTLLRRAMESGIPTLILADGILEYRNTWEHPQVSPGSHFQPAPGHKVACIGRSQARTLEAWGNTGRCEIVGAPRFDRYASLRRRVRKPAEPFRLVVMTAMTPYFTEEHHERVVASLRDLKECLASFRPTGGCEVVWRITKGLEQEVGVANHLTDLSGGELSDLLQNVDAAITTPSTTMLEAMLLGMPVALLDYCNRPHYVPAAWSITARDHIAPVLSQLVEPPEARMLYQDSTLHDCLECRTPAAPRLAALAESMLECGAKARREGGALNLPARMVGAGDVPAAGREARLSLAGLFPGNPDFENIDPRALQVELVHLRRHAAALERKAQEAAAGAGRLHLAWRSRLEAGLFMEKRGDRQGACELMLESVRSVQSCGVPAVIYSALVEVGAQLRRLDPGRAAYLLGLASKLAGSQGWTAEQARAAALIAEIERAGAAVGA